MDEDKRVDQAHNDECLIWIHRYNTLRGPAIANWVSTFRDGRPSEFVGDLCGSFNWCCIIKFDDNKKWLVRFAAPGRAMNRDEKILYEVTAMRFIKTRTNIPVPEVFAWGSSADNPLDLGPFIIMEFVEGQSLGAFLEDPSIEAERSVLRSDVHEDDLDVIYRQIAGFLLELSKHEFPRIGSLIERNGYYCPNARPLTVKVNEVEAYGGVKVGPSQSRTFSSATEYFHNVGDQDLQHLQEQPNSIYDAEDAKNKYVSRKTFDALVPRFVSKQHNHGPFKLICEDLRFGNMLVNNYTELKILAVLDWEWAYTAPYQMLYSPPRWLLMRPPAHWDKDEFPNLNLRYKHCFKKFVQILQEEEDNQALVISADERMSSLMRQSMDDGKLWFHELIYAGFLSADHATWAIIRAITSDLDKPLAVPSSELDTFAEKKVAQLSRYKEEWEIMRKERESLLRQCKQDRAKVA